MRTRCALRLLLVLVAVGFALLADAATALPELYGADTNFGSNTLVKIDPASGAFQTIGNLGVVIQGLAYAPESDQLYGLSAETHRVYRINRSNAAAVAIGVGPHPYGNANGLAYDWRRHRFIASSNAEAGSNNQLFAIDPLTGIYTTLASVNGANDLEGLGYDPATDTLYGLADKENRIVSLDPITGTSTTVAELPSLNWRGLEYDPFRRVFYASVSLGGDFYEISLSSTPTVRFVGFTSPGTQGLAVTPEPGLVGCFIGAALLGLRRPSRRERSCARMSGG